MDKLKELEPNDQLIEMRDLYKKEEREVSKRVFFCLFLDRANKGAAAVEKTRTSLGETKQYEGDQRHH
jgi:hypothetical protein